MSVEWKGEEHDAGLIGTISIDPETPRGRETWKYAGTPKSSKDGRCKSTRYLNQRTKTGRRLKGLPSTSCAMPDELAPEPQKNYLKTGGRTYSSFPRKRESTRQPDDWRSLSKSTGLWDSF